MSKQKSEFDISQYIGKRIGISTVIGIDKEAEMVNKTKWVMKCDCGNIYSEIPCRIIGGHKKSCGCYRYNNREKHGKSREKFYSTWVNVVARCYKENSSGFENYGGRGIKVCEEWKTPALFIEWAIKTYPKDGRVYSIDRIDNNGPYSPQNCKWSTKSEQQRNRRNNLRFEIDGVEKTLIDWCEVYKIGYTTVWHRIKMRGWSIEKALTTPVRGKKYERL